jgi:hypothetical protein
MGWVRIGGLLCVAVGLAAGCGDSHDRGADTAVACTRTTDCVVVPASCCGVCGAATREDVVAIHRSLISTYRESVCEGLACPACYMEQDPSLVPTCGSERCEYVDLRAQATITACSEAADCRVRTVDCCECGGDTTKGGVIALRTDSESAYSAVACVGVDACPECAPAYPEEVTATCNPAGFCEAVWSATP